MSIPRISAKNLYAGHPLDTVGDGTGSIDFAQDYSGGGATKARLQAPSNFVIQVDELIIWLEAIADFQADRYVPSVAGDLPIGIHVEAVNAQSVLLRRFTEDEPVHTIGEFAKYTRSGTGSTNNGSNKRYFSVHLRFGFLILAPGEALEVVLNDDFSGLSEHRFLAHGLLEEQIF